MSNVVFLRGISHAPSDTVTKDGECCESINVWNDGGEVAPALAPSVKVNIRTEQSYHDSEFLFLHKIPGGERRYIVRTASVLRSLEEGSTTPIVMGNFQLGTGETIKEIRAIGNTLIVLTSSRTEYMMYKAGGYVDYGDQLPDINFTADAVQYDDVSQFGIDSLGIEFDALKAMEDSGYIALTGKQPIQGITTVFNANVEDSSFVEAAAVISNAFWEEYNATVGRFHKKGLLTNPIFVRFAWRLYDGTYACHSAPILLDPNNFTGAGKLQWAGLIEDSNVSSYTRPTNTGSHSSGGGNYSQHTSGNSTVGYRCATPVDTLVPYYLSLSANAVPDAKWADIIAGLDIFISQDMHVIKPGAKFTHGVWGTGETVHVTTKLYFDDEMEDLKSFSNFYLVRSIDFKSLHAGRTYQVDNYHLSDKLGDNLVVQPTLPDDYISHVKLIPSAIIDYNKRLNILNADCGYYPWYPSPTSVKKESGAGSTVAVYFFIKNETGTDIVVKKDSIVMSDSWLGPWLYYPDANCYKAEIYTTIGTTKKKATVGMTPHPFLNGAFYFYGWNIPESEDHDVTIYDDQVTGTITPPSTNTSRFLNKTYQSDVNNPFIFRPENIHTVPAGRIFAAAAETTAISQGQFGQYPLLLFCEDGIWAMSVSSDGRYDSMKPLSRDVCNNPRSVTELDGAVAFTTDKGVMLYQQGSVKDLSENIGWQDQLYVLTDDIPTGAEPYTSLNTNYPTLVAAASDETTFREFISGCNIAFDYPGKRLILLNSSCSYQYVYMLETGEWHKLASSAAAGALHAINSYPECLVTTGTGQLIDFTTKATASALPGLVVTRALAFDAPEVRKTIRDLRLRGRFQRSSTSHVRYILLASMDGLLYRPLASLHGGSYKYFRIVIISDLGKTERLSFIEVDARQRFNEKMR